MNGTLLLGVLQIAVLLLALLGGGIFPATVCMVAVLTFTACSLAQGIPRIRERAEFAGDPSPSRPPGTRVSAVVEVLIAAILVVVLLSAVPLPPLLDPLVGHLRAAQNQAATTLLKEATRIGFFEDGTPWFSLSRNRAGTLRMFLLLGAVFGSALCTASLSPRLKKAHLVFLACAGAVIAAGGYVGQWIVPQGNTLWWTISIPPTLPGPVGCFINRNHFAGFVAMLCPVALALTYDSLQRKRWLSALFSVLLTAVMLFSLFMTHSRGAILAFLAGSGFTLGWIVFRRHRVAGALCVALIAGMSATLYLKTPSLQNRFRDLGNMDPRGSVQTRLAEWRETLRTARHYPIIGTGANALRMVYPMHRHTSGKWLVNAENEYVQLVAEGGAVGLLLAGSLAVAFLRRIHRDHDPENGTLRLAAIGALLTAAVHNGFDFPARQPLYAMVLGSLAGMLLSPPPPAEPPQIFRLRLLPAVVAVGGCAVLSFLSLSSLQRLDSYSLLGSSPPAELRRALVWAPTSWNAWYMSGRAACDAGIAANRLDLCVFGETLMTRAAQCDPNNYRLWYDVGLTRRALRQHDSADKAFARATELRSWLKPPPVRKKR